MVGGNCIKAEIKLKQEVYTTILTPPSPLPVALGAVSPPSTDLRLPQKSQPPYKFNLTTRNDVQQHLLLRAYHRN